MENNEDVKTTEEKVEETTQKTYTVEDVNNSYKAGVKKARAELEQSEEYKKYQDWIKEHQNDGEKIKNLETSNLNKDKRIMDLEAQLELKDSDVKPEFIKFVKSEVLSMVNDDTDFATALKNFKKDNAQYFGKVQIKKVQTSPGLNNGGNQPQTTNQVMNDLLRGTRK